MATYSIPTRDLRAAGGRWIPVPLAPTADDVAHPSAARVPSASEMHAVYLRRRVTLAVAAVVLVAAALLTTGLLAGSGGDPASAAGVEPAIPTAAAHVAADGDTIWSIAHQYRGEVAHGRYVDALIRLNGGTSILVGQVVHLP